MPKLEHAQINFNLGKKKKQFDVVHNLSEYGLDIESAFVNWSARTNIFTVEDFCKYVTSKDTNLICEKGTNISDIQLTKK